MNEEFEPGSSAWQPITPAGVAAFAHSSFGRLVAVQTCVALIVGAAVIWSLLGTWYPVIDAAVERLPAQGEIRAGTLEYGDQEPVRLAGNRFLALAVDLRHSGQARAPAHFYVEFGKTSVRVFSLLGHVDIDYPRDHVVAFNRTALGPWWGARRPVGLAIAGLGSVPVLIAIWGAFALVYLFPVRVLGFLWNRDLPAWGSWKLACAALMPGALFIAATLCAYRFGLLDLPHVAAAVAAHFALGWIYLVLAPLCLPRSTGSESFRKNPFASGEPVQKPAKEHVNPTPSQHH